MREDMKKARKSSLHIMAEEFKNSNETSSLEEFSYKPNNSLKDKLIQQSST